MMNISRSYLYRILKSLKDRWFVRTTKLVYTERYFDWWHSTDTAGRVYLHELEIVSENKSDGGHYEAASHRVFCDLIRRIAAVDLHRCTFLDYGSGKGCVMMIASWYMYQKIIGVEFSKDLFEVCQRNLKQYHRCVRMVGTFEVVRANRSAMYINHGYGSDRTQREPTLQPTRYGYKL